MKKLLLLALVALVAGSAFASTDPAFTGKFRYSTQLDFTAKDIGVDDGANEAKVALNGVVDEWSTVSAELKADGGGNPLELNQFTLTTDVTGALGVDGPVAVTFVWGAVTHKPAIYQSKAGYADNEPQLETDSYVGSRLEITVIEKVKVIALIAPTTYVGSTWTVNGSGAAPANAVITVELQLLQLVEGLDANLWYVSDKNLTTPSSQIGLSAGYGSDMFDAGLIFVGELEGTSVFGAGVAVKYKMDVFNVGAAFGVTDFSDFGNTAGLGVNLTWKAVADVLDVFGAATFNFANFSNSGFEGGVKVYLGSVTYSLGYDYQNAGFVGPENTVNGGLYLKVDADF